MTDTNDAGLSVVKGIYEALQIDDEWSTWSGRGFEWWGIYASLVTVISASGAFSSMDP